MPVMTTVLDYDAWEEKYKPVQNHIDTNSAFSGTMFETFGAEVEYINSLDPSYVWTYFSDEEETIESGRGFVNRMGYFVTEVPWHEDDRIVVDLSEEWA